MELLCIMNSKPIKDDPRIICVCEGSRYHLTNTAENIFGYGGIQYQLLETGDVWHDSICFTIAPPILEETIKTTIYEKSSN